MNHITCQKNFFQTKSNVITVDWRYGAKQSYFQAVANSRVAGAATAHVMNVLHETFGANYSNMYMIGWSLGAHVAGYAGEEIKSSGNLIGRITG
jgi:triacylglycerol lipase